MAEPEAVLDHAHFEQNVDQAAGHGLAVDQEAVQPEDATAQEKRASSPDSSGNETYALSPSSSRCLHDLPATLKEEAALAALTDEIDQYAKNETDLDVAKGMHEKEKTDYSAKGDPPEPTDTKDCISDGSSIQRVVCCPESPDSHSRSKHNADRYISGLSDTSLAKESMASDDSPIIRTQSTTDVVGNHQRKGLDTELGQEAEAFADAIAKALLLRLEDAIRRVMVEQHTTLMQKFEVGFHNPRRISLLAKDAPDRRVKTSKVKEGRRKREGRDESWEKDSQKSLLDSVSRTSSICKSAASDDYESPEASHRIKSGRPSSPGPRDRDKDKALSVDGDSVKSAFSNAQERRKAATWAEQSSDATLPLVQTLSSSKHNTVHIKRLQETLADGLLSKVALGKKSHRHSAGDIIQRTTFGRRQISPGGIHEEESVFPPKQEKYQASHNNHCAASQPPSPDLFPGAPIAEGGPVQNAISCPPLPEAVKVDAVLLPGAPAGSIAQASVNDRLLGPRTPSSPSNSNRSPSPERYRSQDSPQIDHAMAEPVGRTVTSQHDMPPQTASSFISRGPQGASSFISRVPSHGIQQGASSSGSSDLCTDLGRASGRASGRRSQLAAPSPGRRLRGSIASAIGDVISWHSSLITEQTHGSHSGSTHTWSSLLPSRTSSKAPSRSTSANMAMEKMRRELATNLVNQQISLGGTESHVSDQFDEESNSEDLQFSKGTPEDPKTLRLLCVFGVLPMRGEEDATCCFSSCTALYQSLVVVLTVLACAMFMYQAIDPPRNGSCDRFGLLSDLPLAGGSTISLLTLDALRQSTPLRECYTLLFAYAEREGFLEQWREAAQWDSLGILCFWTLAIVMRLYASSAICAASDGVLMWQDVLNAVSFFVSSGVLVTITICIVDLCRGLANMIDMFCCRVISEPQIIDSVAAWNILEAVMRKVSGVIENCFFALQMAASCAVGLFAADALLMPNVARHHLLPLIPGALVTLCIVRVFFYAAQVTDKCNRVPALVNSINPDVIDHERKFVVEHILHSAAGFYVFEVRLTSAIVLRFSYMCLIVVSYLTTDRKSVV